MVGLQTFTFFILGLVLGSFYNVVGLRIPKKQSIITPRSHCVHCKRELSAIDLIPVISYIALGGRCRTCKGKFSPVYMWTEGITAILFAFAYIHFGLTVELYLALVFVSLLVIISVSDLAYMIIPDKVLLFFLPLLVIGMVLSPLPIWWDSIIGAVVGFSLLLLVASISKGGMGGGDIKLFFLIGLVLGTFQIFITLMLAAFIGLITGVITLQKTKQGRKTPIPFGPSIAVSALIIYFYGEKVIAWYIGFF